MRFSRLMGALAATAMSLSAAWAQDIKIGANLPMSGPNAEYGELFSSAAAIAVEHANADKMLSRKLVMLIEDSQATPQQGLVAMNKLVNVEKVPYVLSAFTGVCPRPLHQWGTRPKWCRSTAVALGRIWPSWGTTSGT